VWASAAWLLGTLAVQQLPELPGARWWMPLLLAALVALRYRPLRPLLVFAAAAAWTCWFASARMAERLPFASLGHDFALTGAIAGFPSPAPGQMTFPFAVAEPRPAGVPPRVRLTWYEAPSSVMPGDALAVTARLRPPRGARNPGGFDYEQWLLVNDYGATGYVREGTVAGPADGIGTRWLRFRAELAARLGAAATDADGAALLTALALGERFLFTEQHWADFRRTGTSHLVAVSGMHVALLGLVVFAVLRRAWLRLPAPLASYDLEVAAGASVLATVYYAALTGFAVPAQRSLVMIAIALTTLASRRVVSGAQILAATLLAVLVWDPFAPQSASFWLSFVAVAILLALAAPRPLALRSRPAVRRAAGLAVEFVRLQWWIGLALLPLTAWYFGEISLVGPLVNLVAIPFFNLCLVPLTVLVTIALSFEDLVEYATPLVQIASYLASATVSALHTVAGAEWAALSMPLPPPAAFVVAALGVALAVCGASLPGRRLAWLALLPLFMPALRLPEHGTARVIVLDVGHGLAVLVETRGHRLLFDAGPTSRSGFDSGEALVIPALAAAGRRGLDRLIVSHADNDHAGGAAAITAAFPDVDILTGPDVVKFPGRVCERGEEWEWDGVRFGILHPSRSFGARGNESSCVLKIATRSSAVLVTGDIERLGESASLTQPIGADVVVVPHHGSATSSSPSFVAAVGAEHAIVSAGHANRWGFPKPEVRERWERSGAAMVVTGDSGAVTVVLGPDRVTVATERDGRHRYWQTPTFPW
jgi:competence protein ComEC